MTAAPLFSEPVEGELILPPAPPEDAPPDVVTLSCEFCGESFTGRPGGPNSAPMQLGRHRKSKHGEGKTGKAPARGKGAPAEPESVAAAVADAGAAVTGKGAPSEANLTRFAGTLVKHASRGVASWAYDSTPDTAVLGIPADPAERAPTIEALSIPQSAAETIMRPVARLLQPTALNRKYGRKLVENTDLLPAIEQLTEVGRNWAEFLRTRRELIRMLREHQLGAAGLAPPLAQPAPGQPAPGPVAPVLPVESFGPVDPFLGSGTVAAPPHR